MQRAWSSLAAIDLPGVLEKLDPMVEEINGTETYERFSKRAELHFENPALLIRALTHRSYVNENPEALEDNERLEFLGDAVLDFIVAAWLYHHYPELPEGNLTQLRTALVCTEQLAEFARWIRLGPVLRLGQGENSTGGRDRDTLLCASFEAVIGSYYLDQGIAAVETYLHPLLERALGEILSQGYPRDPKSLLQEWTQARGWSSPVYRTVSETGPDHSKKFLVEVSIANGITARGQGMNKREASKAAAGAALEQLRQDQL